MTESTPEQGTEETEAPKRPRVKKDEAQKPTVGRVVHYQLHGQDEPLAAIVTAAGDNPQVVSLVVFREHLSFFRTGIEFSDTPQDGCWGWPPRA